MQQADTKSFFYEKHIKFLDSSDRISDYNAFLNYLSSSNDQIIWRNDWKVFNQIDGICFYKLKKDDLFNIVNISIEILIDSEMNVRIISEGNEAEILEIQWLLKDMKLEYWNQFHCLLDYYGSEPIIKLKTNPSYHVQKAIENLNRISSLSTVDNLINPVKTRLAEVLDEICFNKDPFLASDVKVEDMVIKEEPEYGNVAVECVMFEEPLREPVATFEDEVKKHYTNKAKRLKNTNKSEICKIIKDSNEESQSTQCQFCDKICKSRMHLHSHLHNAHVDHGCCDICGKVFKSKKRLKAHMTLHKERERAKCPHCGDEMLPQNLRRYIRVSHEGYRPFGW
ncbi:CLUMA_CG004745, isoform A [Clunio marinus]|uniref:CLUMA_CG004745, isoform A n=1 Tax=Clunio marinus TaxID=568069 RepID=A0A1J1HY42_9DIPT|nr:CLUMA_CG004745, isoform A [Clunio marinus]